MRSVLFQSSNLNKFRVLLLTATAVVLSFFLLSCAALDIFRDELTPEMQKKGLTLGESINDLIVKSVDYGVPFDRLRGMDEYLDSLRKENAEVLYIVVSDNQKKILYKSDKVFQTGKTGNGNNRTNLDHAITSSHEISSGNNKLGTITIGMDGKYFEKMVDKILLDIITVGMVSLLVAFELLSFIVSCYITAPTRTLQAYFERIKSKDFSFCLDLRGQHAASGVFLAINNLINKINHKYQLIRKSYPSLEKRASADLSLQKKLSIIESEYRFADEKPNVQKSERLVEYMKWPFFLLIFSEALAISFFPHYVDSLYQPFLGLSRPVVIGLPISIFMLVWAISLPWAGAWSDRVGRRKAFIYGALITGIGLFLNGTSQTLLQLMVWRSLTAIGYSIVFITCQAYINENSRPELKTQGMAVFLSGFFAGSLCGAAIGGILADRIGYQQTLFLSGFISLIAAAFAYRFISDSEPSQASIKPKIRFSDYCKLLSNRHFFFITFFSAIPAKIALTGFLYYCIPLFMKTLGGDQSSTGRGMMAYGLVIVFFAPYIALHASSLARRKFFMILGGLLTSASLFLLYYQPEIHIVFFAVATLGLAHAIGVSPQFPVISDLCTKECQTIGIGSVMGIFRMIERIGNVSGPILAAVLVTALGFEETFLCLAWISLIAVAVLTLHLCFLSRPSIVCVKS